MIENHKQGTSIENTVVREGQVEPWGRLKAAALRSAHHTI